MENNNIFFERNGFKEINNEIIIGCQKLAEQSFNTAPFKPTKKNCVIVFKQDEVLYSQMKRDYNSATKQAKELLEQKINSIIFIFTNYPQTVIHHIATNDVSSIPDYDGKGKIIAIDFSKNSK